MKTIIDNPNTNIPNISVTHQRWRRIIENLTARIKKTKWARIITKLIANIKDS
jgi:hypothetical protein